MAGKRDPPDVAASLVRPRERLTQEKLSRPQKRRRRLQVLAAHTATSAHCKAADTASKPTEPSEGTCATRLARIEKVLQELHWAVIGQWSVPRCWNPDAPVWEPFIAHDPGHEEGCQLEEVGATHLSDVEDTQHEEDEIGFHADMNRGGAWCGAWHSCPAPLGASKHARTWRRLSARLCYEERYDEMKRPCDHCGAMEYEDDSLVPCRNQACSLSSAIFHGRCADALGYVGGKSGEWSCPWCPTEKAGPTVLEIPGVYTERLVRDIADTFTEKLKRATPAIVEALRAAREDAEDKLAERLKLVRRRFVQTLPADENMAERTRRMEEFQAELREIEASLRRDIDNTLMDELDISLRDIDNTLMDELDISVAAPGSAGLSGACG